jgi:hypothetical protein
MELSVMPVPQYGTIDPRENEPVTAVSPGEFAKLAFPLHYGQVCSSDFISTTDDANDDSIANRQFVPDFQFIFRISDLRSSQCGEL